MFVYILELIAKANTSGDSGNLKVLELLEAVHKVEERGLALDRGRDSHDDLLDLARKKLVAEQVNLKV